MALHAYEVALPTASWTVPDDPHTNHRSALRIRIMRASARHLLVLAVAVAGQGPTPPPSGVDIGCDTLIAVGSGNFGFEVLPTNCTALVDAVSRSLALTGLPVGAGLRCIPTPLGRFGTANYLGATTAVGCNATATAITSTLIGIGYSNLSRFECDPSPYLSMRGSLSGCRAMASALQAQGVALQTASPTASPTATVFACYQPSAANPRCTLGQVGVCECPLLATVSSAVECAGRGGVWAPYFPTGSPSSLCRTTTPSVVTARVTTVGARTTTSAPLTALISTTAPPALIDRPSRTDGSSDGGPGFTIWYIIGAVGIVLLLLICIVVAVLRRRRHPSLSKADAARLASLTNPVGSAEPSLRMVLSRTAEAEVNMIALNPTTHGNQGEGSFPRVDGSGVGRNFSSVSRSTRRMHQVNDFGSEDDHYGGGIGVGDYLDETET
jgi:hypothetical protein